jgi:hypothetical protein
MGIWSRCSFYAFSLAASACLAGCSNHPLPENVSMKTTPSIILAVRCEARAELYAQVQRLLRESQSPIVQRMRPEDVVKQLAKIQKEDRMVADLVKTYAGVAIGYHFFFDITEDNKNSATADFSMPIPKAGFVKLGATGRADLTREAMRTVEIVEHLQDLAALNNCSAISLSSGNLVYPLTGSIGMREIIRTFLRLSEANPGANGRNGDQSFSDTLDFVTTISVGATPSITIAKVSKDFHLVDASGTFSSDRTDHHRLIVAMKFPERDALLTPDVLAETRRKAAEELCIQRTLVREETFGIFRANAPERYCQTDVRRLTK